MTRKTAIPGRGSARFFATSLLVLGFAVSAFADDKADPIVARIGTQVIRLSELNALAENLPPQARQMPREQLMPRLLEQRVDTRLMASVARKMGLDKDPVVVKALHENEERTLASAMLEKEVGPKITDAALKARFDQEGAGKAGTTELHARHILVDDEAVAKKIIAELKKGADFAALSKQYNKDKAADEQGGDLGYFKAGDMVPEFSAAAFALKDKEVGAAPVRTQFGWHVIQTLDRRTAAPPSFDQSKEQLRQQVINEEIRRTLVKAREDVVVERFNLDGSPIRATDMAVPPPPPAK